MREGERTGPAAADKWLNYGQVVVISGKIREENGGEEKGYGRG